MTAGMLNGLTRQDRVRYARQLSLPEIGEAGQLRLMQTQVALPLSAAGEQSSDAVAALYLERAGLSVVDGPAQITLIEVPSAHSALQEAAAFLSGALTAAEAIKAALGVGTKLLLPDSFALAVDGQPNEEHRS